ncbi:MAG: methyltransferase family protein, partial [Succinivibrio sp.]
KGHGGAADLGPVRISRRTDALVTTGPYALCRNPMHLGLFLFYLGLACAINSLSSLAVPALTLAFAYISAVHFDEPRLRRDFTESYAAWSAEVPRFLPSLRRKKF